MASTCYFLISDPYQRWTGFTTMWLTRSPSMLVGLVRWLSATSDGVCDLSHNPSEVWIGADNINEACHPWINSAITSCIWCWMWWNGSLLHLWLFDQMCSSFRIILSFVSGGIYQESRQVILLARPVKDGIIMLPDGFLAQRTLQPCGPLPGVYAITGSLVTPSNASLSYPILVAGNRGRGQIYTMCSSFRIILSFVSGGIYQESRQVILSFQPW
jgi:hypothetical protein